jgi:flavodoxin
MKAVVIYYSLSGKTEITARTIAEELGADIKHIEEIKSRHGFAEVYVNGGMAASMDKCSEINPMDVEIENYDLVVIGTPDWASKPAPAVNAFIAQHDFSGRDVVVFSTSGGNVGTNSLLANFKNKVVAKGGNVVGSFNIRSSQLTDAELAGKALDATREIPDLVREKVVA